MEREERKQEIINSFKSFEKDSYNKSEIIKELFSIEKETVELTFNKDHSDIADLKIWDVFDHLEKLNEENGSIANESLANFKDNVFDLSNYIKTEILGKKGETIVRNELFAEGLENKFFQNIEISDGKKNTEIDFMIVKENGVYLLEVKNISKNIFIDRTGDFYYEGENNGCRGNIVDKMKFRENLIKTKLNDAGFQNIPITSILVFTNKNYEFQNDCSDIKACFLSRLSQFLNKSCEESETEVDAMEIINEVKRFHVKEAYPSKFDANKFKENFAEVMTTLEFASFENNAKKLTEEESKEQIEYKVSESFFEKAANYIRENPWKFVSGLMCILAPSPAGIISTALLHIGGAKNE